jgi:hypothetical protein
MIRVLLRGCEDGQEFPLYFEGSDIEEQISHACVMLGATELSRAPSTTFEMQCEQVMVLSQSMPSYQLVDVDSDTPGITCLHCKRTSYNPNDISHHYCGYCHAFHEDTRES